MKVIYQRTTRPSFNLAMEEYLLRRTDDEYFLLWQNERSIIVGKNQNTLAEINYDFVKEHNISVIRRQTGGGAVFHDLGNLNYTFIIRGNEEKFADYSYFTRPIIEALAELGVKAELSGRNDLLIDGKKFSGNAQCFANGGVMHHGTLMFNADVSKMSAALNVNPLKVQSKGIKSVKSRVTNISEHLPRPVSFEEFVQTLLDKILLDRDDNYLYEFTDEETKAIEELEKEKYATWEWNFGFRREYTVRNEKKFSCGIIETQISLDKDKITDIRFFGDYFGKRDVAELEQALAGVSYNPESIKSLLSEFKIEDYFLGLSAEELLSVIL
ncbi:MAG: lipoate--protein ligase [Acutalibacteraceae bacterium]